MSDKVVIYQSVDGEASLDVRLEQETVWLRQKQMAELFGRERCSDYQAYQQRLS